MQIWLWEFELDLLYFCRLERSKRRFGPRTN
jgi:hypothetical protein